MWYFNRLKFIKAQFQNPNQKHPNYEYFSKFPDFDPSDPDSFFIAYSSSDPRDIKTKRMLKLELQRNDKFFAPQDYSSQKKFAEEIFYQRLQQGRDPFVAVKEANEAVFNNFDNTFSSRDKIIAIKDINNYLSQLANNELTEINKNLQQQNILRDQLYRQGLEVIKDLKSKKMTNKQIESHMSSKLNNIFNQGQISEQVKNLLDSWFAMKINGQN